MHIVFLIHGLFGNPDHLLSMEESLKSALNTTATDIRVHRARCMSAVDTFDGIKINAAKLKNELLNLVKETKATHLSIVGYSFGGLCGRYLIGDLYEMGLFERVTPFLYATFATPHLGSQYSQGGLFGSTFNMLGSNIVGIAGKDLFCSNSVVIDLADPSKPYLKGLAKFKHHYLFANTIKDRTVHFWTSYITTKNPFLERKHLKLKLFDFKHGIFMDLRNSKWLEEVQKRPTPKTWKQLLLDRTIRILVPVFLVILVNVMTAISLISYIKRTFSISTTSHPGDGIVGQVGDALEETLELGEQTNESAVSTTTNADAVSVPPKTKSGFSALISEYCLNSPGYEGLIESCPSELSLDTKIHESIRNLNTLPWKKFAIRLSSINTHGQIVDRNNNNREGKELMNQFASVVCTHHNNEFGKDLHSNL